MIAIHTVLGVSLSYRVCCVCVAERITAAAGLTVSAGQAVEPRCREAAPSGVGRCQLYTASA